MENNVICDFCGSRFHKKPSHIRKKNYCSKKCHDMDQFKGEIKKCTTCGKEIRVSPSLIRMNNFCSNECRLKWLGLYMVENINVYGHSHGHKAPHLTALNRERNPKLALEPDAVRRGTYETEKHRKVMENVLGRKLKPYEDVHHVNGIHNDNRPENLQVLSHSEHLRLHWKIAKERGVI